MKPLFAVLMLLLLACDPLIPKGGPDAGPSMNDAGVTEDGGMVDAGRPALVVFTSMPPNTKAAIDATSDTEFTAIDLDHSREVPFREDKWDLAFVRFRIRSRGGFDGDGGVEVAPITDAGYDNITRAPSSGFLVDQPDGPGDMNTEPDTVFETAEPWYFYNVMEHVLHVNPVVYVVKTDEGAYFKVQMLNYYDPEGTPAMLSLRFARVTAP